MLLLFSVFFSVFCFRFLFFFPLSFVCVHTKERKKFVCDGFVFFSFSNHFQKNLWGKKEPQNSRGITSNTVTIDRHSSMQCGSHDIEQENLFAPHQQLSATAVREASAYKHTVLPGAACGA